MVAPLEGARAPAPIPSPPEEDRVSILLVDDQPANLGALEATLESTGCRFVLAKSADEALLALLNEDFAAIVLDIRMPGMSGFELASMIKRRQRNRQVPILFLTAHMLEEEDVLQGYAAGAVDYLTKPINPGILRSKIAVFVDLYRNRRSLSRLNASLQRAIAERQQMEDALRKANQELESRVQERTVALREAERHKDEMRRLNAELQERQHGLERLASQLENSNKELESFSYSVSHDLRAPLRAIDGFSHALLEEYGTVLPAEGRRLLGTVRESTQRMGRLIDDLLAFSRLGRKELDVAPVDLASLAHAVVSEVRQADAERQVQVTIAALPPVAGDGSLLRQVLTNLIGNAFKFTRNRPDACIEIGSRSAGGEIVYYVKDNGAGFEMRHASKLFGVFQRLHRSDEFEGSGVGLALVQRIVQRHGGRVWGEGRVNEGATFYFTLPPGDGH